MTQITADDLLPSVYALYRAVLLERHAPDDIPVDQRNLFLDIIGLLLRFKTVHMDLLLGEIDQIPPDCTARVPKKREREIRRLMYILEEVKLVRTENIIIFADGDISRGFSRFGWKFDPIGFVGACKKYHVDAPAFT
jgi:hypothetical protein